MALQLFVQLAQLRHLNFETVHAFLDLLDMPARIEIKCFWPVK